jgi:hypothetical protein
MPGCDDDDFVRVLERPEWVLRSGRFDRRRSPLCARSGVERDPRAAAVQLGQCSGAMHRPMAGHKREPCALLVGRNRRRMPFLRCHRHASVRRRQAGGTCRSVARRGVRLFRYRPTGIGVAGYGRLVRARSRPSRATPSSSLLPTAPHRPGIEHASEGRSRAWRPAFLLGGARRPEALADRRGRHEIRESAQIAGGGKRTLSLTGRQERAEVDYQLCAMSRRTERCRADIERRELEVRRCASVGGVIEDGHVSGNGEAAET